MNRERILILAKLLEMAARKEAKPKLGFNMGTFGREGATDFSGHYCGTSACIAGWAAAAFAPNVDSAPSSVAADALELPYHIAGDLFYPGPANAYSASPRRAARVLRHLAKTGKVDWSIQ